MSRMRVLAVVTRVRFGCSSAVHRGAFSAACVGPASRGQREIDQGSRARQKRVRESSASPRSHGDQREADAAPPVSAA